MDTDKDILEALYRKYYSAAYAYCIALCGNVHLAEDIAADAFVKSYLSLPNDVQSFRYWLLRVCKNLWIDHLRRQQHVTSDEPLQYISDGVTPEMEYIKNEQRKALWKAIGTLAPPDRELLTLHYFSGLPLHEIAPLMGKSYATVRQRMVRLRQELKQRMEEQGYGKS